MKSTRLELKKVTKIYKSNGCSPVVRGVNLSVEAGTIVSLWGENGSGKTTILKMISGLIAPTSGRIMVNGYDISTHRRQALQCMGAILEGNRSFYWQLTPQQNLEYFGVLRGIEYRFLRAQIQSLLCLMELERYRDVPCKNLSRGFQQRVAIALALIADPPILLLDEPTLGLDHQSCAQAAELIKNLGNQRGRAIFLATHHAHFARSVSHRIVHIEEGQIMNDINPSAKPHLPLPASKESRFPASSQEMQKRTCSLLRNLIKREETNDPRNEAHVD
jgi:ABC-2 type transport system ATP-binding protein